MSQIIESKNIKCRTELLALAQQQKEMRSGRVHHDRQPKIVAHVIKTTWDMLNAQSKLERNEKSRIQSST